MSENFTFGKRPANLHHSDPYWDSDDMVWRRKDNDEYDDEANDTRPDSEKYTNAPLIVGAMILVLLGLAFGLMWILDNITTN